MANKKITKVDSKAVASSGAVETPVLDTKSIETSQSETTGTELRVPVGKISMDSVMVNGESAIKESTGGRMYIHLTQVAKVSRSSSNRFARKETFRSIDMIHWIPSGFKSESRAMDYLVSELGLTESADGDLFLSGKTISVFEILEKDALANTDFMSVYGDDEEYWESELVKKLTDGEDEVVFMKDGERILRVRTLVDSNLEGMENVFIDHDNKEEIREFGNS